MNVNNETNIRNNLNEILNRKHKRNWKPLNSSPKRMRLKRITFKNTPNTRNLNKSNNAIQSRKSIVTEPLTRESHNIEHLLERQRTRNKTYRKRILNNLKQKGKLFKE